MQRNIKIFTLGLLCFLLFTNDTFAQEPQTADFGEPKTYEIGGVKVNGAQFSDDNALIAISGLKVGDKIRFPGPEIPRAIKALWKLKLFTDVKIYKEKTIGEMLFLEINVIERSRYTKHSFVNLKKNQHEDVNGIISKYLTKGTIVTDNAKAEVISAIKKFYVEKGYLDIDVNIKEDVDKTAVNAVKLLFDIDRNERVKIKDIVVVGNQNVKTRKILKQLDKTKKKSRLFASSKLIDKEYEDDKNKVIKYYNKLGYRDALITGDSVWRLAKKDKKGKITPGHLVVQININEGKRYYFRNINWKGNSIYETEQLERILGIKAGDVFNQELLDNRLRYSQDGRDVSSLYMDNGYLFFNVDPVEVAINRDSLDIEMRIFEGPQATIDRVVIKGNDRTHEHVIRREIRTKPGEKFSRADIIRSQREITNLGYFNPEKLGINTPVNAQRGTVDIEYTVEEKPSDQLELSAGWGGFGRGVIGTLGVSFNNFSMRNIGKRETWSPLPQGDGQKFSLRGQTNGKFFQSYNASFTEPWLGGKKPRSFTTSIFHTIINQGAFDAAGSAPRDKITMTGGSIGIGQRLKFPDDNFVTRTEIDFRNFNLSNVSPGSTFSFAGVTNGSYNNLSLRQTIARSSVNNPLFPEEGSNFSLTMMFTPPYSLLRGKNVDYEKMSNEEKFKWVEYHKWRFNAEWYTRIVGKLVLKSSMKLGILGSYNNKIGISPFERFQFGGNGLNNQQVGIIGRDIISSRGYEDGEYAGNFANSGSRDGAAVFNKMALELRYPISLNPQSTIFGLAFVEGGNAFKSAKEFNPFEIRRSAGVGLRVFLPMFGLLGFDYGLGIDKKVSGSEGLLKSYGRLNIILGFEPD
jgi:outer membrane protein insertion porin family